MSIQIKRAYLPAAPADGCRILVDRLWPRGLSKGRAAIDEWLRDVAPSAELRKWFGHRPERWPGFKERFFRELTGRPGLVAMIAEKARKGPVTLVYSAKDEEHNNAVVLKEYLEKLE